MVERHGRAGSPRSWSTPRRRRPTRCAPRSSADEARGRYRRPAVLDSEQSVPANHADDPGADKQQRRGLRDRPRDVFMLTAPRGESFAVVAIALVEHRYVRHFSPPQCFERRHQIPEVVMRAADPEVERLRKTMKVIVPNTIGLSCWHGEQKRNGKNGEDQSHRAPPSNDVFLPSRSTNRAVRSIRRKPETRLEEHLTKRFAQLK
jgi:hypothetical protein